MNRSLPPKERALVTLILVAGFLVAYFYGEAPGIAGMSIGLAGGAFGGGALLLMIRLLQFSAGQHKPSSFGVALVFLMVGAKIPVLIGLSKWSQAIGAAAFDCFLAGVMLVYFGLIAWAGTRPIDGPSASDGNSAS